ARVPPGGRTPRRLRLPGRLRRQRAQPRLVRALRRAAERRSRTRRRGVPPDLGIPPGARRLAHGLAGGTSRRRQHFPPGEPEPVRRARVGLHPMGVTGHVVFSHGLDGSPFGTKIRALYEIAEAEGYEVAAVDYRGVD